MWHIFISKYIIQINWIEVVFLQEIIVKPKFSSIHEIKINEGIGLCTCLFFLRPSTILPLLLIQWSKKEHLSSKEPQLNRIPDWRLLRAETQPVFSWFHNTFLAQYVMYIFNNCFVLVFFFWLNGWMDSLFRGIKVVRNCGVEVIDRRRPPWHSPKLRQVDKCQSETV